MSENQVNLFVYLLYLKAVSSGNDSLVGDVEILMAMNFNERRQVIEHLLAKNGVVI